MSVSSLFRQKVWIKTALILGLLVLSACGKKPSFVDPPQGKKEDTFPRTYPAPVETPFAKAPLASPEEKP